MSNVASAWAWSVRGTGPTPKLVLAALADQADDDGWCWPSQAVIAERCEMGERTVRRHIATLRDLGLLTPVARSSTWGRRSNGYQLHVGRHADGTRNSLGSRQPANLAGCDEEHDAATVDNSSDDPVSVVIPATGQSGRLRKRPDWPVAQEANVGRPQPANAGRLHIGRTTNKNHQTEPDQEVTSTSPPAAPAPSVGSGPVGVNDDGGAPERGAEAPAPPRAGDGAEGAWESREGTAPWAGRQQGRKSSHGASGREVRGLLADCLPEWMLAMDPAGARAVAGLLAERLEAGWRPAEIRTAIGSSRPGRVGRMSSLVASRLRTNVDPAMAPAALVAAAQDARREASQRRADALVAEEGRERGADEAWGEAMARARDELGAGASMLDVALRAGRLKGERAGSGAGDGSSGVAA